MGKRYHQSLAEKIFKVVNTVILLLLAISIILPYLNILALSFNDGEDAASGGIYFWVREFTLENYTYFFRNNVLLRAYGVTIFRTVVGTLLSVFLTAMAAYALKSKHLPGGKVIFKLIFITSIFSGGIIPYYLVLIQLNLTKSLLIYILPMLYSFWNLLIIRTFYKQTISISIEESATIDGCNDFQIFFKIILPLSKPVIAVITLFNAVGHWNDWATGAFFVRSDSILPAQTLLQKMMSDNEAMIKMMKEGASAAMLNQSFTLTTQSLQMAMVILVTVPIILVYPFLQKYFIKGMMIGSLKG